VVFTPDIDLSDMATTKRPSPLAQQMQQPQGPPHATRIEARYMVPADQQFLLPTRARAPQVLPPHAVPATGTVVYLSNDSAWVVELVVHEWLTPIDLSVEVWITHVGSLRHARPPGFKLTQ
ncbi:MAG: hypothetical protein KJ023_00280, partial [Burkholderiaceae bacterium]|nr:hypothetical protein [Burkholderiaceae bacterium]